MNEVSSDIVEFASGTRVQQPGFGRTGTVYRYETKFRTRWVIVKWDGEQFTERCFPRQVERIDA